MQDQYEAPILTIDGVVFQLVGDELAVLLIKRAREPFKGQYALPGGYNPKGETTTEALERILSQKAGLKLSQAGLVEQLYTFDAVGRDPRGHAVSVVYMVLGSHFDITESKTSQTPAFFALSDLPELAYDHAEIIQAALERLRSKIGYTNAAFALLPVKFTLSQLQRAYEAVLGKPLDKRNFRKRFLALQTLDELDEYYQEGRHRPARLYSFKTHQLTSLSSSITE